ncbi:MAG TPA: anthranilate phosphoribosyltransferase [Acidobacteriaceae bacterium]|nr:anthranilate phosphoribosyltransferase [Acidobacteriaceae bacterium]
MSIRTELRRIVEDRATLSRGEATTLMQRILASDVPEMELAALLGAMAGRGETAAEIAGFAQTLRALATPLPLTDEERTQIVDTCGTGGDGSGTFNISTAAALVAAAAGAKVAKHGNRAITSRCGSADVLDALGIPTEHSPDAAAEALRKTGFCFLLAPAHHPAMKALMPIRRALGVRTILHVLGPLLNPAGAKRQVMGVYAGRLVAPVAQAMVLLGTTHGIVVHGHQGLDELSLSGPSDVAVVHDESVRLDTVAPDALQLGRAPIAALAGGDAQANAAILRAVFTGERGPRRDVVLLNAAAVLVVAGLAKNLPDGIARAAETIDSGSVVRLIVRLQR